MQQVRMTPAQWRIALMVAAGQSNPDIARVLGLSESTVKNHLNAIYGGGVVVNREELINYCRTGKVEPRGYRS
ncbi:MAG TPA: helix-turn-helix transcriptional regulator [Ktedonobacteraceae bacterium]